MDVEKTEEESWAVVSGLIWAVGAGKCTVFQYGFSETVTENKRACEERRATKIGTDAAVRAWLGRNTFSPKPNAVCHGSVRTVRAQPRRGSRFNNLTSTTTRTFTNTLRHRAKCGRLGSKSNRPNRIKSVYFINTSVELRFERVRSC